MLAEQLVGPHCLNMHLLHSGMGYHSQSVHSCNVCYHTHTHTHTQAGQGLGHRPAVDASQVSGDSFNTDYGGHCHRMVRGLKGKNGRVLRAVTRDYH